MDGTIEPILEARRADARVVAGGEAPVVQLRAERLGTLGDRIYTLTATAKDLAGNTATAKATCTVPHDQGSNK